MLTLSINNLARRSYLRIERLRRQKITLLRFKRRKRGTTGPRSAKRRAERAVLAQSVLKRTIVPSLIPY